MRLGSTVLFARLLGGVGVFPGAAAAGLPVHMPLGAIVGAALTLTGLVAVPLATALGARVGLPLIFLGGQPARPGGCAPSARSTIR